MSKRDRKAQAVADAAPEAPVTEELSSEEPMADGSPADAPLGKPVAQHALDCSHGSLKHGDELPESCLGCFMPGRDFVIVEM